LFSKGVITLVILLMLNVQTLHSRALAERKMLSKSLLLVAFHHGQSPPLLVVCAPDVSDTERSYLVAVPRLNKKGGGGGNPALLQQNLT
jgi:hypothetical protein